MKHHLFPNIESPNYQSMKLLIQEVKVKVFYQENKVKIKVHHQHHQKNQKISFLKKKKIL